MPNKTRNIEATRIFRPIACGQVIDDIDAVVVAAIVDIIFGVNLLAPAPSKMMWRRP